MRMHVALRGIAGWLRCAISKRRGAQQRRDPTVHPGRHRCYQGLTVALLVALLIPAQALGGQVTQSDSDSIRFFHNGWSISFSGGGLSHGGVVGVSQSQARSDYALGCGIGRSLDAKVILEAGSVISFPRRGLASPSTVQGMVRLRWYPAALRPQRDQLFLQGEGVFLWATHTSGGSRHGGGIGASIGMDYFLSQHQSLFVEAGFGIVQMSRMKIVYGEGTDPRPPDRPIGLDNVGGLAHLSVGVRFDL